jgi:hypothetical protein
VINKLEEEKKNKSWRAGCSILRNKNFADWSFHLGDLIHSRREEVKPGYTASQISMGAKTLSLSSGG